MARNYENPTVRPEADSIRISVILPVYNVAPWIGRCIDSLKKQTLPGLEFIFVEDCSADNSLSLIEAFAREDDRVRILRNDINIGAGPSRNKGIEAARGEYLSFIDPDDFISPSFLSLLYRRATSGKRHDIAKGRSIRVSPSGYQKDNGARNALIERNLRRGASLWLVFCIQHWSAIYNASLFKDSALRYGESRVSEDTVFLLRVGSVTRDIVFDNDALYYYAERPESTTQSFNLFRIEESIIGLIEKRDALAPFGNSREVKDFFSYQLLWLFTVISQSLVKENPAEDAFRALVHKLDETLQSLPDYDYHLKTIPEWELLCRHYRVLPLRDVGTSERLRNWEDFLHDNPSYRNKFTGLVLKSLALSLLKKSSLRKKASILKQIWFFYKHTR